MTSSEVNNSRNLKLGKWAVLTLEVSSNLTFERSLNSRSPSVYWFTLLTKENVANRCPSPLSVIDTSLLRRRFSSHTH